MHAVLAASRRNAAIVLTGLGLGVVIGGIGGRLAMYLLARLNPEATGVVSDDGFVMGQFTLSGTLNLLVVGGFLGTFGGVVYALARHLTFGPPWWRLMSVALGAGLPVGALIVHTDGVRLHAARAGRAHGRAVRRDPRGVRRACWRCSSSGSRRPPSGWGRLEALRWLLRAGAAAVVVVALLDLASDVATLT